MAIPHHHRRNFETLLRAAADGNLALLECADAVTGEPRYAICAVSYEDAQFCLAPFGHFHEGDPYSAYLAFKAPVDVLH